jgi:peptidyl-prolyl cis-trans isomerase SurA
MIIRFSLFALTLLAGAALAQIPASGAVVLIDRIVAVVNDEVITRNELEARKGLILGQLKRQGTPLPAPDVLEKQVLERLLTERAQLHFAKENGIRVDDAFVERTIARIAEDNKITLTQLREMLAKDGVTYAKYREDIRSEIILSRLREREVDSRIVVSDAEIDHYLATNEARAGKQDEYRLAHILVLVPEQASPEQIGAKQARAEEALRQIRAGADFAQVAAGYSDAGDALKGGELGWRPAGRIPSVFAEAVTELKSGDTSKVLRSANGFHILKLLEKRGKDSQTFVDQTRVRHILLRVSETVSEAEAKTKLERLRGRVVAGEDFAELAKLNSEDPSSAKGGEVGWVSPGDTVPEFEKAMNGLKFNEVSEAVRTPFGWHLIQPLERRRQDVTETKSRELARQAVRARKIEEGYEDWLRQVRDRAFVEYRLEEK